MIKFFRQIRQRMIKENRASKYLLYAIGEIILVVIGILIAVSIDTWNKKQDIETKNEIYCYKLLEELKLNISRLQFLAFKTSSVENINEIPSWNQAVKNCDSLLVLVARGLQEKDHDFFLHVKLNAGGAQLNLFDATYEELLGTGNLYNLGSDSLILGIKNYYKHYEREIYYNKRWSDYTIEGLDQIQYSWIKMQLDQSGNPESFNLHDYPWFFDSKSKEYIDLQLGVRKMFLGQDHHLRKSKVLIESTEHLIGLIEREIQETNK